MNTRIINLPDLLSGLMFLLAGVMVALIAEGYIPGTAAHMGPGYFPRLLGGILALLGAVIATHAIYGNDRHTPRGNHETSLNPDGGFDLRRVLLVMIGIASFWIVMAVFGKKGLTGLDLPVLLMLVIAFFASRELFWVLLGIAAFGMLLEPAGMAIASFALILVSAYASHEFHWKASFLSWLLLLALCWAVFGYGLKMQFSMLPAFLN